MNRALEELVSALRDEMHQYGAMLLVLDCSELRPAGPLGAETLERVAALRAQGRLVREALSRRLACQSALAQSLGQPARSKLEALIHFLPWPYQPLLLALAEENARLERRVADRIRQSCRQLSRALESLGASVAPEVLACQEPELLAE
jgi:hypothetical protein